MRSLSDLGMLEPHKVSAFAQMLIGREILRFRQSRIDGTKVEVARSGMSGNLAYELHGPYRRWPEDLRRGVPSGPRVRHRAAGLGNLSGESRRRRGSSRKTWTFIPVPGMPDEMARAFVGQFFKISGSVDPADFERALSHSCRGRMASYV
jgi:hypothetical protein